MTGLAPDLRDDVSSLASVGRLLVALDFDGTLAPFVDDPSEARALPAATRALSRLVQTPNTFVALVSGRSLASLRQVASPDPGMLLIGSHGAERFAPEAFGAAASNADLSPAQRDLLGATNLELAALAQEHHGAWVEEKPAGLVLHTRMVDPGSLPELTHEAMTVLNTHGDNLHVTRGKNVIEVSVLPANKGQGLDWLRAATAPDAILFAGDDRTDEDAFVRLDPSTGDVGVKVGSGETAAQFRVDGPGDVAALLESVADMRD